MEVSDEVFGVTNEVDKVERLGTLPAGQPVTCSI